MPPEELHSVLPPLPPVSVTSSIDNDPTRYIPDIYHTLLVSMISACLCVQHAKREQRVQSTLFLRTCAAPTPFDSQSRLDILSAKKDTRQVAVRFSNIGI